MNTVRPSWDWALPESIFRTLTARYIVRVEHDWKFLTEDTSEAWINLTMSNNDCMKGEIVQIPSHMLLAFRELFEFSPDHAGLFRLTSRGQTAQKRLAEIKKFNATYDRDRRDYERLKRKFAGEA